MATAPTAMTSVGSYDVSFANVDDRLCLWIDGRLAEFDRPTEYVSSDVPQPGTQDLAPVGIAVRNATAVVSDLLLQRDIYYRNDVIQFTPDDQLSVLDRAYSVNNFNYTATNSYQRDEVNSSLLHLLTNPSAWSAQYAHDTAQQLSSFGDYGDYKLADDEYLMFGDNSSMSKDSRLFDYETRPMSGIYSHRYAVRERDLIGKALFIFWPHGVPFLNDGKGIPVWYHKDASGNKVADYPSISVPFYPNLSRMKKIR